jgi:hypothetical protein
MLHYKRIIKNAKAAGQTQKTLGVLANPNKPIKQCSVSRWMRGKFKSARLERICQEKGIQYD